MSPANKPLPKPNVTIRSVSGEVTAENIRAMFCNPIYTGLGPYPRMVDDEQWIRAAAMSIKEDGAEQWLVNLLHTLRHSIGRDD